MDATIQLFEAEIPHLRRYARFLAGDIDVADDLVQECLVRAIAKVDSWEPGTHLRAWLFVILRNCYFSDVRRENRSPVIETSTDIALLSQVNGNQESSLLLNEVRTAIASLSDEHREVLLLVAIEEVSYQKAAEIIHVPIGTVRSRASRARDALRTIVEGENRRKTISADTEGKPAIRKSMADTEPHAEA